MFLWSQSTPPPSALLRSRPHWCAREWVETCFHRLLERDKFSRDSDLNCVSLAEHADLNCLTLSVCFPFCTRSLRGATSRRHTKRLRILNKILLYSVRLTCINIKAIDWIIISFFDFYWKRSAIACR